jgi:hypothetical protein
MAGGADRPAHLFQVRGYGDAGDAVAFEVEPTAASLCSADCFVLCKRPRGSKAGFSMALSGGATWSLPKAQWTMWVWVGDGSRDEVRATSASLGLMVMAYFGVDSDATKVKVIDEAQSENHADFWKCLAGRRTYADHRIHKFGAALPRAFTEAVFFDVRDGGGVARVAGDQRSLGRSTALVVDARCYVFLWLGADVRKKAARRARRLAAHYVAATRGDPLPIKVQAQGGEDPHFKSLFHGWADRPADAHRALALDRRRSAALERDDRVGRVVDDDDDDDESDDDGDEPRRPPARKRRNSCGF